MTEFKIKKDIDMYMKMGLSNQYAVIVSCVQNGVPDKAKEYLLEINEEQLELKKALEEMIPFAKSEEPCKTSDIESDVKTLDDNLKNDDNI